MLYKALQEGFKDIDTKQGIVSGYFARYGNVDFDGDVTLKGAFNKSIKERGPSGANLIAHLLDHNKANAVALVQNLGEDSTGAYYESKAGRHTAGRDFLFMAEDGLIKNHSFGYQVIKQKRVGNENHISEYKLLEVSSLQFLGANPLTPIIGIKSLDNIVDDLDMLEKAMRNGKYSDEAFVQIESKIKSLYELVKPSADTSGELKPIDKSQILNHIQKSFS